MSDPYAFFGPQMRDDPYPTYHRLRTEAPVHWVQPFGPWLVTRFADVTAALGDPRLSVTGPTAAICRLPEAVQTDLAPYFHIMSSALIYTDPPEHTRLRSPLNRFVTPRAAESTRPRIARIAGELVDAAGARGELELLRDVAYPLAELAGAALLGVPDDDMGQFRGWFGQLFAIFAGDLNDAGVRGEARAATLALLDYFSGALADRRRAPRDDLLSALATGDGAAAALRDDERLGLCVQLLFSGRESTPQALGKGMLALLQHPEHLALLRETPALLPAAVEELLRFDGGSQAIVRIAAEDLTIGERRIGKGQRVFLLTAAANRDPAEFPDPDRLDFRRQKNRHLAFGHAHHFCIGAPLARVVLQVAYATLLDRLPGLRLATERVAWRERSHERVLAGLPLVFGTDQPVAAGATATHGRPADGEELA